MAEPSAVAFGRFLRQLRERRGLSLAKVCELSRLSAEPLDKGTLSRLERGQQSPSIFRLGPLTRIYEISADALLERMELDREVDRIGGPDTGGLDYAELQAAGRESVGPGSRKWDAYAYFRDSLPVASPEKRVPAWLNLVTAIRSLGKNVLALHELREMESSEALDPIERVWVHERLANCCRCVGEMKRAEDHAQSAIDQAQALGDLRTLAYAYSTRGCVAIDQEQWDTANAYLLKALAAYKEGAETESRMHPSPSFTAQGLLMLAECAFRLGNTSRTRRLTVTAKKLSEELDLPLGLAYAELLLGWIDDAEGHADQALSRWRKAAAIAAKIEYPQIAFAAEVEIFRQAKDAGDVARARASRRRLERLVPWISRHKPAYRLYKRLIDNHPSDTSGQDRRPVQGDAHDKQTRISVIRAHRAARVGSSGAGSGVQRPPADRSRRGPVPRNGSAPE